MNLAGIRHLVDIRNSGDQPQDLSGWVLVSERRNQACTLGGVLNPGETLRIWARAEDAGKGGYNYGFGSNIWNNRERDPAALYDAAGNLMPGTPSDRPCPHQRHHLGDKT